MARSKRGQRPAKTAGGARSVSKRRGPPALALAKSWSLAELARIAGLSLRTVRYYGQLGLVRPSKFRGRATRYERRELLRLLWVVRMKSEQSWSLATIARRLTRLGDRDLEDWIVQQPLTSHVASLLGVQIATQAPAVSALSARPEVAEVSEPREPATIASVVPNVIRRASLETWERIQLLPGLELMVRSDASPAVRRAAQKLQDEYTAVIRVDPRVG